MLPNKCGGNILALGPQPHGAKHPHHDSRGPKNYVSCPSSRCNDGAFFDYSSRRYKMMTFVPCTGREDHVTVPPGLACSNSAAEIMRALSEREAEGSNTTFWSPSSPNRHLVSTLVSRGEANTEAQPLISCRPSQTDCWEKVLSRLLRTRSAAQLLPQSLV